MVGYRDTGRIATLLFATQLAACAGAGRCPTARDASALTPTEALLVLQGATRERLPVVHNDHPAGDAFLHTASLPVRPGDPAVEHLLARMRATLLEEQGVGIAAPQVGINRRAIWVKRLDLEPEQPLRAYLNPVIEERAGETLEEWEGCLSVPAGFGRVQRAAWIVLAHDRPGEGRVRERVEGYTARIFQHEIDHLDGVLFLERRPAAAPALMPKDEYREMRRREQEAAAREAETGGGAAGAGADGE